MQGGKTAKDEKQKIFKNTTGTGRQAGRQQDTNELAVILQKRVQEQLNRQRIGWRDTTIWRQQSGSETRQTGLSNSHRTGVFTYPITSSQWDRRETLQAWSIGGEIPILFMWVQVNAETPWCGHVHVEILQCWLQETGFNWQELCLKQTENFRNTFLWRSK